MNIFVVSKNVDEAAQALDDLRLRKMLLETGQIISTNLRIKGYEMEELYNITHRNHPCTKWARERASNLSWLVDYFCALHKEYQYRFKKNHKTFEQLYPLLKQEEIFSFFPKGAMTEFADCSGWTAKHGGIEVRYQFCLGQKWKKDLKEPRWTRRMILNWAKGFLIERNFK